MARRLTIVREGSDFVVVERASLLTKRVNQMTLPLSRTAFEAGVVSWVRGAYVQDAFPTLTADHREFLMTGANTEEWNAAFPEED